ncbi:MAG: DUF1501 domain-containing protein [Saprospiraceae bacterium]|nr:DUF1501 domain-containing protein [Saprospiraceae bacterium]
MSKISRRNFLQKSAITTAGTMCVPFFLKAWEKSPNLFQSNGRRLVIIQFSGGNDGLNTMIPFEDDLYYSNRPNIAIAKKNVTKLNAYQGFNPAMSSLKNLYDSGDLAIVNSVGYPDPDRSHFRSMDIWHTASNANEYLSTGWLGRYLDKQCDDCQTHQIIEVDDSVSLALKGKQRSGFAVSDPNRLYHSINAPISKALVHHHHGHDHDENVSYLYKVLANTASSADYLFQQSKIYKSSVEYPQSSIGKDLKQVAELIISGSNTEVYYVTLGGFDTHANQKPQQERLLKAYAESVSAFVKDLKANDKWKDTLIMNFSEFGRRVKENGSRGTDHGAANNLYLMGGSLKKAGFYNNAPNLANLNKGDLAFEVDFRRVYADVLKSWLKVDDKMVLGSQFKPLGIV